MEVPVAGIDSFFIEVIVVVVPLPPSSLLEKKMKKRTVIKLFALFSLMLLPSVPPL